MQIHLYNKSDQSALINLLKSDPDWASFTDAENFDAYEISLMNSYTLLAYEEDELIGYIRCLSDEPFFVYVVELLIKKEQRKKGYGKALINQVKQAYPNHSIYVLSENDEFYTLLKAKKCGHIFKL